MQLDQYDVRASSSYNRFEFMSAGNNGNVLKIVEFVPLDEDKHVYNLGFGDVNSLTGDWDDKAVTNNGDRNKVLATVANLVVTFLDKNPNVIVYAEGSTPIRNALYRRTIERFWHEISKSYEVKGYTKSDNWVNFEQGGVFVAFLIKRK